MREEGGITEVSLANIQELTERHGRVKFIYHDTYIDDEKPEPITNIYFEDGFCHEATGFAVGYRGEGPSGLAKACNRYLDRTDITPDVIQKLGDPRCYLFTRGQGTGELILAFAGVMDSEFDVEVF